MKMKKNQKMERLSEATVVHENDVVVLQYYT